MGNRLGEISKHTPKPLLRVAGKTLVHYMIDFVNALGFEHIIVVGGYQFDKVSEEVSRVHSSAVLVENKQFALQNLLSFSVGIDQVESGDVFVCNTDYIFSKNIIHAVSKRLGKLAVYASWSGHENLEDVMRVKADGAGNLLEMSKQLLQFDAVYTGMFFVPENELFDIKRITKELLKTSDLNKTTVEALFAEIVKKGGVIKVEDVGNPDWYEIDTPEEWEMAKKALE